MKKRNNFIIFIGLCGIAAVIAACTLEAAPETMRETVRAARHYTVTFDTLGGSAIASQTVVYKARAAQPGNPVRSDGWLFGGWYREVSCTNRWNFNNDIVTQDITLYARWADPTYARAVIFRPDGGTPEPESPIIVLKDEKVPKPQQPGKPYHNFKGWFSDPGFATEWDFDAAIGNPGGNTLTLYAKWEIWTYPVFFNVDGNVSSETLEHGSFITRADPTKADHIFYSWYRDAAFTQKWNKSTDKVTGTMTLYARWVPGSIPGLTLAEKLEWIATNAQTDTNYDLYVVADETLAPQTLSYGENKVTVTLKGFDEVRTISLSSNGSMFTIGSGITLVLDNNISLKGRSSNNGAVVYVNSNGALIMNTGSKITGNTNTGNGGGVYLTGSGSSFIMKDGTITGNTSSSTTTNSGGGGVYVGAGSKFNMEGGTISGNSSVSTAGFTGGGAVYILTGEFNMSGGEIKSNNSATAGGGVFMRSTGTFTMSGSAAISGNTASSNGGGVYVYGGTFIMSDDTVISGNTATSNGGGVYVDASVGSFTMSGGTIGGSNTGDKNSAAYGGGVFVTAGTFTMSDNAVISGNTATSSGGGVYVTGSGGSFTMSGGTIGGNTTNAANSASNGGGVYVTHPNSKFTMNGGEIAGNIASTSGGGVHVASGTFTKAPAGGETTSGTIYGYPASPSAKNNLVKDGANRIDNKGHAVYVETGPKRRETTAGPTVSMDSNVSGAPGGWEN